MLGTKRHFEMVPLFHKWKALLEFLDVEVSIFKDNGREH